MRTGPRPIYSGCAALLLLGALAACTPLPRRETLSSRQWQQVVEVLRRGASADDLVAAALVTQVQLKDNPGALALLDRALTAKSDQPDVVWLALGLCRDIPGCDSAPHTARLLALDPRNAAGHSVELAAARAAGNVAAEDAALAAMASTERFDVYWSRLLTRTTDAFTAPRGSAKQPLRDVRLSGVEVLGWLAAVAIPPFKPVGDTCRGTRLEREDIVAKCRKLAQVLENGDTYIAQAMGRAVGRRVWARGSAELAQIEERQRAYNYISAQSAAVGTFVNSVNGAQRWINRFRANRRESDVYRQALIERNIPPDPPADWKPAPPQ
jgi:hypothetical protein